MQDNASLVSKFNEHSHHVVHHASWYAGQSEVGESFLMGTGAQGGGEWSAICKLMEQRVPPLRSNLLAAKGLTLTAPTGAAGTAEASEAPSIASAPGRAGSAGMRAGTAGSIGSNGQQRAGSSGGISSSGAVGETHLQQMFLEAISNGCVRSQVDIECMLK